MTVSVRLAPEFEASNDYIGYQSSDEEDQQHPGKTLERLDYSTVG
jgi:hypothetical protein